MWTSKISLKDFESSASWKVENFNTASLKTESSNSSFSIYKLSQLMKEKKVTLDPQKFPQTKFCYLGLENVQSLTGDLVGEIHKKGIDIKSITKVFNQGDILYSKLRPYLNKVYLCMHPAQEGICSGEFLVFVPNTELILPNVLRMLLTSSLVLKVTRAMQTGSTLPRIHASDLLDISVPLPPMHIQIGLEETILQQVLHRQKLSKEVRELPYKLLRIVEDSFHIS